MLVPTLLYRSLAVLCLLVPLNVFAEPLDSPEDWVAIHKEPSEKECRSYIERALKEQRTHPDASLKENVDSAINVDQSAEASLADETQAGESTISDAEAPLPSGEAPTSAEDSSPVETLPNAAEAADSTENTGTESAENEVTKSEENVQSEEEKTSETETTAEDGAASSGEHSAKVESIINEAESAEAVEEKTTDDNASNEGDSAEGQQSDKTESEEKAEEVAGSTEEANASSEVQEEVENVGDVVSAENTESSPEESANVEETEPAISSEAEGPESTENEVKDESHEEVQGRQEDALMEESTSAEQSAEVTDTQTEEVDSKEGDSKEGDSQEANADEESAEVEASSVEQAAEGSETTDDSVEMPASEETKEEAKDETVSDEKVDSQETAEVTGGSDSSEEPTPAEEVTEGPTSEAPSEEASQETEVPSEEQKTEESAQTEEAQPGIEKTSEEETAASSETTASEQEPKETVAEEPSSESSEEPSSETTQEAAPEQPSPEEEDLIMKREIPENLRQKTHIAEILKLDGGSQDLAASIARIEENTLKELKRVYETAIKPLEILYKYRDLSNRHFGDAEIFSKPLILFMGPWSGGKSTIINYLLDNEFKKTALRTGAEPSPAYFNIVMSGENVEILDGTQLAADWTFSGLQKFGQGLLDRLRGLKMNHPLLEKVNIVEIPGILEIRKQVERLFPFNDACQWFIDRADIIFLVYDPSKLDVGPETEAILDQLKGREYQTRIILNKADQVKPEELMRVQGTLIWNISPLMSSTEPPVMYSTSLWSLPYEGGSPTRLLFAQEKAFLKDLRDAVEKRVDNKIASARRFAVRVRNHAKMVDCYLTTYYNHKSFFGNKQKTAEDIIDNPQNYHIYEGLSTLTNISRYDLPDPDVYKDFFRLNPVYDFQQLASTCTYFRGCPINRLDVAIAYDLPELLGKFKKQYMELLQKHASATPKP